MANKATNQPSHGSQNIPKYIIKMHIFIYPTLFVAISNVIAPKSNLIVQSDFAMRSGKELNYIKYV